MAIVDKRSYPRLCLTLADGYFGHFILPNQERLVASILNLSAGGINMSVAENSWGSFKEGDLLLLRHIAGGANFSFINDIKGQVRWVKQLQSNNFVSVGCSFLDLTAEQVRQLAQFVDSERMTRGQYDIAP